jgi:hypothetical protein
MRLVSIRVILREGFLKPLPIRFPPWAVDRIRHDFKDNNIVVYDRTLGVTHAPPRRA